MTLLSAPQTRVNAVQLIFFVDADHAGEHITHHSHTGIIFFLNRAPITCFFEVTKYSENLDVSFRICSPQDCK